MEGTGIQLMTILAIVMVTALIATFASAFIRKEAAITRCTKAGYDGTTWIKDVLFCYRATKDGQIEYLRYEYAGE